VTATRPPHVAVVGGYGTGITFRVGKLPGAGETLLADSSRTDPSAKGSNQAVAASRLGAQVSLLSAIGADGFGAAGRLLWDAEGIDSGCVRVGTGSTMVGAIVVEPDGGNRILVGMGALTELDVADVQRFTPEITDADICVVSLEIPAAVAAAALTTARAVRTMAVLNPASPVHLPPDVLRHVDVIVPNRTEAAALTGSGPDTEPDTLADRLRALCEGVIVLTLGELGALVDDRSSRWLVPAAEASAVIDTTGAGDAFTGAPAVGLAHGLALGEAVEVAVEAAARSVSRESVISSLPLLADLPEPVRQRLSAPSGVR